MEPFHIGKFRPVWIGKIGTLPEWRKWDPSGLANSGPFRIGKIRTFPDSAKIWTLPDWQSYDPFRLAKIWTLPDWAKNLDPSGLAKLGPFRIGKIWTPPRWYPSGFVKIAFQGRLKITPVTLSYTVSEPIMLYELTRKGIF